jgi:hypothetical protein
MPLVRLEPTIPVFERAIIFNALERAANVIGWREYIYIYIYIYISAEIRTMKRAAGYKFSDSKRVSLVT